MTERFAGGAFGGQQYNAIGDDLPILPVQVSTAMSTRRDARCRRQSSQRLPRHPRDDSADNWSRISVVVAVPITEESSSVGERGHPPVGTADARRTLHG